MVEITLYTKAIQSGRVVRDEAVQRMLVNGNPFVFKDADGNPIEQPIDRVFAFMGAGWELTENRKLTRNTMLVSYKRVYRRA